MSIYDAADLYDEQYRRYRDDIPHYLRLAADHGGPVLEVGAGTGRLCIALARAGHEVVGIDSSPQMLERGRQNAAREGVELRLEQGDMRDFELEARFPLVVAAFNTLMHLHTLDDQDRALGRLRSHLEPGGAFAFDLFLPDFGQLGVLRSEAEWADVAGEQAELLLVQEHDPLSQTIQSRYLLDTVGEDGLLRRRTATLSQRYYTRFEITRALRHAGFTRLELFGGFDRTPLRPDSRHLVGVARI
ncbi:MAG TPA: class I SAM-dependent methyltransferase [Trueperaceae bacterium]